VEPLFTLLGLLLLAIPVATIVGVVMAIGTRNRLRVLEQQLNRLQGRLDALPAAVVTPPRPPEPTQAAQPRSPAEPAVSVPPPDVPPPRPQAEPPAPPRPQPAPQPARGSPPASPTSPARPAMSFEERFGTQWVVWVGGLALALGGFFLVRLSIEQGLVGPGVRVTLGALLGLAVIAAGEWTRRNERRSDFGGLPGAHIPSILTAAGTTIAYAVVYAAYALYDFLAPAAAFLLLGVVALATLAAALLHGPALAGLGLVGAYVTPLLVASGHPDYWSLYIYLAVVTAAAFGLARLRMWRWLAITAIVFAALWTLPGIVDGRVDALPPHAFHVVVGFCLAALLIVTGLFYGPPAHGAQIDAVSCGALAAYLAVATILVLASRHDPLALSVLVALVTATCAIAWRTEAATAAVPAAGVLTAIVFAHWAVNTDILHLIAPGGPVAGFVPEPEQAQFGAHLVLGFGLSLLFAGAGFLAQGRSDAALVPMLWSASAVFVPLAILVALYYRISGFDRSIPFAGIALLLGFLATAATEALQRRAPRPGLAASGAIFATGAVAGLGLALTLALDKGALTVGLALITPGIAWISEKRPLPALRWLAAAMAVLVLARFAYEPRIVGTDVGTTPIFNWLLYGFGTPAAAFWLAGRRLRRRADDTPARVVDLAALFFTVLLVFLELRHFITGGDVYQEGTALTDLAADVLAALALAIGLERLRQRSGSLIHNLGALALAALALAGIVLGLAVFANPLVTDEPVGGPIFNLILLGYGLPALLAGVLAFVTRATRPRPYSTIAAVAALALALAYLTLQVTWFYHGSVLTDGAGSDAEQYTYSAVWLGFGVALLAAGLWLRSRPVRFASAAVTILTVLKVFLLDMSNLTGIYQALSFIGLGIVLLGIGWFYQRLLFRR
jgi:uncharacterized membrane protein